MTTKPDVTQRAYPRVHPAGWAAHTPDELFAVLNQLHKHLLRGHDNEAKQLLARVWRFESPILKQIDERCNDSTRLAADAFKALGELVGHVQGATDQHVAITQDDATLDYCVSVGYTIRRTYYGKSLSTVLIDADRKEQELSA